MRSLSILLLATLGLLGPGCGGSESDSIAGTDEAVDAGGGELLFGAKREALPPQVAENVRRRDPGYDGWKTEVLHDAAKKALGTFLDGLVGQSSDEDMLEAVLADTFEGCSALRPDLDVVFEDGMTTVLRAAEIDHGLHGRERLRELASALVAPFGDNAVHWFRKIHAVELEGDTFRTDVIVHLDGSSDDGAIQQNMDWRVVWGVVGEELRMRSLEVEFFEEVRTREPLFRDLTGHVFGEFEQFDTEILHGVEHYQNRTDRLISGSFLGMQGIAVGDVNGDGLDDVYMCQQAGLPNRLFLRAADGTLADVTRKARVGFLEKTRSALLIDFDNDGDQDLVVAMGPGLLFARNDGSGIFGDHKLRRATGVGEIYSISAADADGDGDLDVYACRYAEQGVLYGVPTPYHDANNGAQNLLYRNEGDKFRVATKAFGLQENNRKFSLASIWEDFDEDGDLDLYVANDFGRNNLYRNDDGQFTDIAEQVGADDMSAGMGVTVSDFDVDGDMDLYVTNMFSSAGLRIVPQTEQFMDGENVDVHQHYARHARGNSLLANRGDGTFEDVTMSAGVSVGGWAWGAKFVDFNNDGFDDVYSPNGFVTNSDDDDL